MSALALVLDALACPVCAQPFALPDAVAPALVCPSRHTFNLARAGYASLVRGGAPRHAADSVAMVQARASFLARGHYQPIAAPVAEAVAEAIGNAESRPDARLAPQRQPAAECETTRRSASNPEPGRGSGLRGRIGEGTPALGFPPLILDLAGGTGYYLAEVLDAIPAARGLVLDLSPAAAKRAARCHPRAGAATADAWERLPLRDAGVAHVISVFGPRGAGELARVTAPGGGLTVVTPGEAHLAELRAGGWLLGIGGEKTAKLDAALESFELVERRDLGYAVRLSREEAADLVAMGPNAFHLSRAQVDAGLAARKWPLSVTVAATISRYRRRPERN